MRNPTANTLVCQAGVITALLGLMVATYLFLHYIVGGPISCPIAGGGCDTVRSSTWASIFGVSTPLIGIIGYIACLVLGLGAMNAWAPARTLWPVFTTVGLIVSAILTGVEAWVIHAWCFWCLMSALFMTLTWIASLLQLSTPIPVPE